MRRVLFVLSLSVAACLVALTPTRADEKSSSKIYGPDQKQWDAVADNAIKYLKGAQDDNGGWSTKQSPGVTGLVVTGLLQTGKVNDKDPNVERGLKYIEGLINTDEGHIAGKGSVAVQLQNYVTAVNVLALTTANRDSYKPVVKDAVAFLKKLQWDDADGKTNAKTKQDDFFGGAGYDSK